MIIFTIFTDSAEMYQSRLEEMNIANGPFTQMDAAKVFESSLQRMSIDHFKELTYHDKKAIHNLKYFTWIEQQAKELEDLNQLWDDRNIWQQLFAQTEQWDELINEFNERVEK